MKFAPSTAPAAAKAQQEPHVPWPFGGITAPERQQQSNEVKAQTYGAALLTMAKLLRVSI